MYVCMHVYLNIILLSFGKWLWLFTAALSSMMQLSPVFWPGRRVRDCGAWNRDMYDSDSKPLFPCLHSSSGAHGNGKCCKHHREVSFQTTPSFCPCLERAWELGTYHSSTPQYLRTLGFFIDSTCVKWCTALSISQSFTETKQTVLSFVAYHMCIRNLVTEVILFLATLYNKLLANKSFGVKWHPSVTNEGRLGSIMGSSNWKKQI